MVYSPLSFLLVARSSIEEKKKKGKNRLSAHESKLILIFYPALVSVGGGKKGGRGKKKEKDLARCLFIAYFLSTSCPSTTGIGSSVEKGKIKGKGRMRFFVKGKGKEPWLTGHPEASVLFLGHTK